MSYDDFDSDGAATGERRFNKQSNYRSSSNQKASILNKSRNTSFISSDDF